jgi:hypothetical protein
VLMLQCIVVKKVFRVDIKRQIYYHVRHAYKQIQRVKTWQLLIVLVLSGPIATPPIPEK